MKRERERGERRRKERVRIRIKYPTIIASVNLVHELL